jgi:microcin C transport system substrate-binding protein
VLGNDAKDCMSDDIRTRSIAISRRSALLLGSAAVSAAALPAPFTELGRAAEGDIETYGLSTFGDLSLPADFAHFSYVNPNAPKGGLLVVQIKQTSGNQNFDTFDTFNIFVFKGDGAAGMGSTFDSLMAGTADEPDAAYGLVARAVRYSEDKLNYRFLLRPEARFHDGSPLRAKDVTFSLNILKQKGHPTYRTLLAEMEEAVAEADDVVHVRFVANRSRDTHLVIAGMPIFSETYWSARDFEASTLDPPLGSGPYKVGRFVQGRFVEFERVTDYWAKDLPVNVGINNFERVRYEYFRDRQVAFEAFKAGTLTFNEEYTSRIWNTGYQFPAIHDGKVKKETVHNGSPPAIQGWYYNTRREAFKDPLIREALGYAFDFEWTNKNIMFSAYKRLASFFENSPLEASGLPNAAEVALLEPFRAKVPAEVFGLPFVPPVSDGSGSDRALLRRADQMLLQAGCKRDGNILKLPNGKPFEIEFLDNNPALQPHTEPFIANLKRLGIAARSRIVDAAQYRRRLDDFDFDVVTLALGSAINPGIELRNVYSSQAAATRGSRNIAGVAEPAIDAMVEHIASAKTKEDLQVACRVLDRLLRAGRYWIPMWYRDEAWIAFWDAYSRPDQQPKYGTGAPDTWWWDNEKARRIGMTG